MITTVCVLRINVTLLKGGVQGFLYRFRIAPFLMMAEKLVREGLAPIFLF